ncbi:MAG: FGGY family carbohydrate kinase [Brevinema sp.]
MITLGIDLSTQSCSLCILDTNKKKSVISHSTIYRDLPQIKKSPMDRESLLIPAPNGCAEQDPSIFLYALEEALTKISQENDLSQVVAIQISAQQHGHVYLNDKFRNTIKNLNNKPLAEQLIVSYAYPYAPIWRSSDTYSEATALRQTLGGKEAIIQQTGSDSPLRFTGAIIKKFVDKNPYIYQNTTQILLLNTWLAAIMSGNPDTPCDFGNGAGTSLMNYHTQQWDSTLISSISSNLSLKLPSLSSPNSVSGYIAPYFQQKYRFHKNCIVGIGTGDNPASKVVSSGDILSLGTSFVYMKNTDLNTRDFTGTANAMFDGLGNPFTIFCRTNGSLVWDQVREIYQTNYLQASKALVQMRKQFPIFLWQVEKESLPISPPYQYRDDHQPSFEQDYRGIILSSLCLLQIYTNSFGKSHKLSVTGGPTTDTEILQIIANIWECPVEVLPSGGAALGAALAASMLIKSSIDLENLRSTLASKTPIQPDPTLYTEYKQYKIRLRTKLENLIYDSI